ncbi:MAG: hypothetical protein IJQ27_03385 [Spirochaetia bacterium]|nr:hypothetical protein [Spirochaetia bacterium]
MFSFKRCSIPDCSNFIFNCTDRCLKHSPDTSSASEDARRLIKEKKVVRDLCFEGLELEDFAFDGKLLHSCFFKGCTFIN